MHMNTTMKPQTNTLYHETWYIIQVLTNAIQQILGLTVMSNIGNNNEGEAAYPFHILILAFTLELSEKSQSISHLSSSNKPRFTN